MNSWRQTCRSFARALALAGLYLLLPAAAGAEEIHVAVAGNFSGAIQELVRRYERQSSDTVLLAFGSSGKHYAQIVNGAPFEAFFSADVERPARLEREGAAVAGSRFTYAIGRLVLWSPRPDFVDAVGKVLEGGEFRFLSIANPRLAPYGAAAEEVLRKRGLWESLQPKIMRGENISQTFQYVHSGNAELGFVALSQIKQPGRAIAGSFWEIPRELYAPIEQQAVLLKENPAARNFLNFVQSPSGREIIRGFGYETPRAE